MVKNKKKLLNITTSTDFDYNAAKDNGSQITNYILVADATFNLDEIVKNGLLSVTIITPQQRLSVGFKRENVEGGHSNMTEMMLARMIVGFEDDGKGLEVYSKNPGNIYLLTEPLYENIIAWIPNRISQKQFDKLNEYIAEAIKSKAVNNKQIGIGVVGRKRILLKRLYKKIKYARKNWNS